MKTKECVLEDRICNGCGECDKCDLQPTKLCNNCGKCIDTADYRAIEVDEILLTEE